MNQKTNVTVNYLSLLTTMLHSKYSSFDYIITWSLKKLMLTRQPVGGHQVSSNWNNVHVYSTEVKFQWSWSKQWEPVGIMARELVPIVLSCAVWGPYFARCITMFQCDNPGLIAVIKRFFQGQNCYAPATFDIRIVTELRDLLHLQLVVNLW